MTIWGVNFFSERGFFLSSEIFIHVEDTLGQGGPGARSVGRLHLSGQHYWGMNCKIFADLGHFYSHFFSSNLVLSNVCFQNDDSERNLALHSLKLFF